MEFGKCTKHIINGINTHRERAGSTRRISASFVRKVTVKCGHSTTSSIHCLPKHRPASLLPRRLHSSGTASWTDPPGRDQADHLLGPGQSGDHICTHLKKLQRLVRLVLDLALWVHPFRASLTAAGRLGIRRRGGRIVNKTRQAFKIQ